MASDEIVVACANPAVRLVHIPVWLQGRDLHLHKYSCTPSVTRRLDSYPQRQREYAINNKPVGRDDLLVIDAEQLLIALEDPARPIASRTDNHWEEALMSFTRTW